MTTTKLPLPCLLLALSLGIPGCSDKGDRPELGEVQGTVTLDGKPLSGVIISFQPDTGRPATATTDSDGKYELIYRYGVKGAKLGPNTVTFAWPTGGEGGPAIPEQYAAGSTLKQDVKAGANTFDFQLKSK